MPHVHTSPQPSSLRRTLVQTLVVSLIPLGTAFAQSGAHVRVASEQTEITERSHARGDVIMTAAAGTVFDVLDTEGDRYAHRKSNWYLVVLPSDAWGTRRTGWISGRAVEQVQPVESAKAASMAPAPETGVARAQAPEPVRPEQMKVAPAAALSESRNPAPKVAPKVEVDKPEVCEVVLNFRFGKSDLTDEAKGKLASAVATLKGAPQGVSFALEGHADSTGPEAFNEKLGLARAETVKRYLAEQHMIPPNKITVTSFGESAPAASNATREGRAQNRRVVVKVGA